MRTTRSTLLLAAAAAGVLGIAAGVRANTYTWTGSSSSDWNTGGNWSPSGPPTSADTAVFSGPSSNTSVTLSGVGNALGVNFNGSTGYTVGTTGGSAIDLGSGGYVDVQSGDSAAQVVNAPIVLGGNETFSNDASGSANTLTVGGSVTGTAGVAATDTLTLTGTNTGANAVNGVIADGSGGGNVAVAVTGGSWTLGGVNTYSGGTTVENKASLEYTNTAAFGSGTITMGAGSGSGTYGTLVAGVGGTLANNITTVAPGYTGGDVFNTNGVVTKLTGDLSGNGWTITGGGTLEYTAGPGHNSQNGDIVTGGATLELASGGYFGYGYLQLQSGHFVMSTGLSTNLAWLTGDANSTVSIASGSTLQSWGEGTNTYSGTISGGGNFTVNNVNSWATGGSLALNGTNALANLEGTIGLDNRANVTIAMAAGLSGNEISFIGGVYNGGNAATSQFLYLTGTGSMTLGAVAMSTTTDASTNTIDAGGSGNTVTLGAISAGTGGATLNTLVLQDGKFVLSGGITSGTVQVAGTGTLSSMNFTLGSGGTLNGSGTLTWNLSGNTGDLLTDNGTLNITGLNLVLNITGTQSLSQYVLVDYAGGTLTGTAFATVTGLPAGWTIDYSGTVLHPSSIVLSRVPEPAALGLLGVGGLGLLLVGRRRMA